MNELFSKIASKTSDTVGSPWAFISALFIIVIWSITGSIFHFSDTWQLVINTATSIVTLLIVFLIQNTQNRTSKATHLKLDELLRTTRGARTSLIDVEDISDKELQQLQTEFKKIHERYAKEFSRRLRIKRSKHT